MAEPLRVRVSLEYGFIEFEWIYPGTLHELFTDYAAGLVPFYGESGKRARGDVIEDERNPARDFDIQIHIHEADDSDIRYGEWVIDPAFSTEKTCFKTLIAIEGMPGRATYDAVTALAVAALEAA